MINTRRLRESIVVIPKDNLILDGTIKENLDIYSKYSLEYMKEFIFTFNEIFNKDEFHIFNDLNYKITGNNLSEGQKSLIQILRGILKKPKILCLDESNAELDDETEKILFDIMFKKFTYITYIVIAHKLNILRNFDRIIVLDHGKIKEINSPNHILNI
jgi:ATP-binding cassette subfamily C (CFTR/MRP) protein 1